MAILSKEEAEKLGLPPSLQDVPPPQQDVLPQQEALKLGLPASPDGELPTRPQGVWQTAGNVIRTLPEVADTGYAKKLYNQAVDIGAPSGVQLLKGAAYGLAGHLGKIVGADERAEAAFEVQRQAERQREALQQAAAGPQQTSDINTAADLGLYLANKGTEQAVFQIPSLATGLAGKAVFGGSRVFAPAAKAAAPVLTKALGERFGGWAAKSVPGALGYMTGELPTSVAQEVGITAGETVKETGSGSRYPTGLVSAAGLAGGVIETIDPFQALAIGGAGKVASRTAMGAIRQGLKAAILTAPLSAPSEGAQEMLQEYTEALPGALATGKPLFTQKRWEQAKESGKSAMLTSPLVSGTNVGVTTAIQSRVAGMKEGDGKMTRDDINKLMTYARDRAPYLRAVSTIRQEMLRAKGDNATEKEATELASLDKMNHYAPWVAMNPVYRKAADELWEKNELAKVAEEEKKVAAKDSALDLTTPKAERQSQISRQMAGAVETLTTRDDHVQSLVDILFARAASMAQQQGGTAPLDVMRADYERGQTQLGTVDSENILRVMEEMQRDSQNVEGVSGGVAQGQGALQTEPVQGGGGEAAAAGGNVQAYGPEAQGSTPNLEVVDRQRLDDRDMPPVEVVDRQRLDDRNAHPEERGAIDVAPKSKGRVKKGVAPISPIATPTEVGNLDERRMSAAAAREGKTEVVSTSEGVIPSGQKEEVLAGKKGAVTPPTAGTRVGYNGKTYPVAPLIGTGSKAEKLRESANGLAITAIKELDEGGHQIITEKGHPDLVAAARAYPNIFTIEDSGKTGIRILAVKNPVTGELLSKTVEIPKSEPVAKPKIEQVRTWKGMKIGTTVYSKFNGARAKLIGIDESGKAILKGTESTPSGPRKWTQAHTEEGWLVESADQATAEKPAPAQKKEAAPAQKKAAAPKKEVATKKVTAPTKSETKIGTSYGRRGLFFDENGKLTTEDDGSIVGKKILESTDPEIIQISREDAQAAIDEIGATKVKVGIINNPKHRTSDGRPIGGVLNNDGSVTMNIAFFDSVDDFSRAVRHEVGHTLLQSRLGKKVVRDFVRDRFNSTTYMTMVNRGYEMEKGETVKAYVHRMADEWLALHGEENTPVWKQFVLRIKQFLERTGLRDMTDAEAATIAMADLRAKYPKGYSAKKAASRQTLSIGITGWNTLDTETKQQYLNRVQQLADKATSGNFDTRMSIIQERNKQKKTAADYASEGFDLGSGMDHVAMAKLLRQQLYGKLEDAGLTTTKELLQNSFDAIKATIARREKAGNTTPYHGTINFQILGTHRIRVTDNGNGMSPETVRDAFLVIAGTEKEEGAKNSGGFGVAKGQFLYSNTEIILDTVRDGVRYKMHTTGEDLWTAFQNKTMLPPGSWSIEDTDAPNGTMLEMEFPQKYEDPESPGVLKNTGGFFSWEMRDMINKSPLNPNVTVTITDGKYGDPNEMNVGKNFDWNGHAPFIRIKFPWGMASILVQNEEVKTGLYENVHVLSNGVYQFDQTLAKNPLAPYEGVIPRNIYVNIEPHVKPHDPMYPINISRGEYAPAAKKLMDNLNHYVWLAYRATETQMVGESYGFIEKIGPSGVEDTISLIPQVQIKEEMQFPKVGDTVVVKDDRFYIDGKEVPLITAENLKKVNLAQVYKDFMVDQNLLDPNALYLRDNATITDALDEWMQNIYGVVPDPPLSGRTLSSVMREKFGSRYDKLLTLVHKELISIRKFVADKIESSDYSGLLDQPIGILTDKQADGDLFGVHISKPFKGVFINPFLYYGGSVSAYSDENAGVEGKIEVSRAAYHVVNTVIHEFIHEKVGPHQNAFLLEQQRVLGEMLAKGFPIQAHAARIGALMTSYNDIFSFAGRAMRGDNSRPTQKSFESASLKTGTDRESAVDAGTREAGRDAGVREATATGDRRSEVDRNDRGSTGPFGKRQSILQPRVSDVGFYSPLEEFVGRDPSQAGVPTLPWKKQPDGTETITSAVAKKFFERPIKGVTADEIRWSGINDFLDANSSFTKHGLMRFLREDGGVRIQQTVLNDKLNMPIEQFAPKAIENLRQLGLKVERAQYGDLLVRLDDDSDGWSLLYPRNATFDASMDRMEKWLQKLKYSKGDITSILSNTRTIYDEMEKQIAKEGGATRNQTGVMEGPIIPGSYSELLLHTPEDPSGQTATQITGENVVDILNSVGIDPKLWDRMTVSSDNGEFGIVRGYPRHLQTKLEEAVKKAGGQYFTYAPSTRDFTGGHYGDRTPNVVSYARFSGRIGPNGERILFVENMQSDWAASFYNRNELLDNMTPEKRERTTITREPAGPYITKGQPASIQLMFRKMVHWAAQNGYNVVAWPTAEQHNKQHTSAEKITKWVYDDILPKYAKVFGKEWNVEPTTTMVDIGQGKEMEVPAFHVTPQMAHSVLSKGIRQSIIQTGPVYYSRLEDAVASLPEKVNINQLAKRITINVDADERRWTGFDDWIAGKRSIGQFMVSRDEAMKFLKDNAIEIKETVLGDRTPLVWEHPADDLWTMTDSVGKEWNIEKVGDREYFVSSPYDTDRRPGYLETLSQAKKELEREYRQVMAINDDSKWLPNGKNKRELLLSWPQGKERGITSPEGHYDVENLLMWISFSEHESIDGKRVLVIEELQSDWGQEIHNQIASDKTSMQEDMEGTAAIGPWVTNTQKWTALGLRRAVRWAAENGFDQVAWTTGKMQSDRWKEPVYGYGILRQNGKVQALNRDGSATGDASFPLSELPEDIKEKLLASPAGGGNAVHWTHVFRGTVPFVDKGMAGYYDGIVPATMSKFIKQWGEKVGTTRLAGAIGGVSKYTYVKGKRENNPEFNPEVQAVDITPEMKESVLSKGVARMSILQDLGRMAQDSTGRNSMWNGLLRGVLPSAISKNHLRSAEYVGIKLGEKNRRQEMRRVVLEPWYDKFLKAGVYNEDTPLRRNVGVQTMQAMSAGTPLPQQFRTFKTIVDNLFEKQIERVWDVEPTALQTLRDNYFPGMWTRESRMAFNKAIEEVVGPDIEDSPYSEDPNSWSAEDRAEVKRLTQRYIKEGVGTDNEAAFASFFSRRPIEGKKGFLKQKVFDEIMTGIDFGLVPFSNNPVDLVNAKLVEMDNFILGRSIRNERGQRVMIGQKPPAGQRVPTDPAFQIYSQKKKGQVVGHFYVPEHLADIIDNFMSPTLYNAANPFISNGYRHYMNVGSRLNSFQLGVGSAFHAGFTYTETNISAMANILKDAYLMGTGKLGMDGFLKTAAHIPTTLLGGGFRSGGRVLEAWRKGTNDAALRRTVRAIELAGGGFEIERGLVAGDVGKFMQDLYSDRKVKAAMRSPLALVEWMAKPIMEFVVPRQKAGVFAELADRIVRDNPGKTMEQLTPQFRQAWNRVDARLGQVRYNRLFMNNAAKNVIQGLVRAPGWTGGTIAEIGGSVKDAAAFANEVAHGKLPKQIPDRVAYTISLLTFVALINGALTKLFTGDDPEDMDWWAFRTGGKDEKGRPERFLLPTYAKDIHAYMERPGMTLVHKTHPMLHLIAQIINNKDFYGVEIQHKADNPALRAYQVGKFVLAQYTPFWMRGTQKEIERQEGENKTVGSMVRLAVPFVGIMPATTEYTKTKAEKIIDEVLFADEKRPITSEEYDRRQMLRKLRREASLHNNLVPLQDALNKGLITTNQYKDIIKTKNESPLIHSISSGQIPFEDIVRAYNVGTPKERSEMLPVIRRRYMSSFKTSTPAGREELKKLMDGINNAAR